MNGPPDGKSPPPRVMLVDDEADIILSLKRALEMRGFHVDAFDDPFQALENATQSYDAVVFDIRMPKMSGFELYRKFREVNRNAGVFFMTAFDIHQREFEMMFPTIKAAGLLLKPFPGRDLAEAIERFLVEEHAGLARVGSLGSGSSAQVDGPRRVVGRVDRNPV
jgi:two-component system, OmpR family, response regulator ChvI